MRSENVQPVDEARAPLETAAEFGLDEREIWGAMLEVWQRMCDDPVDDPADALAGALAVRILERERRR